MYSKEVWPLISICIPAYNNERFIRDTIQSVLDQTYDNWELIIADDCSQDTTLEIIKIFNDPRIQATKNDVNLGLVGNCNHVMKAAKGEFIKLLCGDDLLSPDCLKQQVQVFTSNKYSGISLVTSYTNLIDGDGKLLMVRKYPFRKGLIATSSAISFNFLIGTNTIGEPGCALFRRTVFSQIGYFDPSNPYCVDLDFWFRIFLTGDLYIIPEPLASFRISKGAISSKIKKQQSKLFKQFAHKIYRDERFHVNILHYFSACFSSYLIQRVKRLFTFIHIKN